jgi:membrane peptidoglycan carboxypeptidase
MRPQATVPPPTLPRRPISDRLAFKPFAVVLLVLVIAMAAGLMAIVLAPPFLAAAFGVKEIDARLQRLGADFTRIPRFPERSTIYASDGTTPLATLYLDNRELVHLDQVSPIARNAVLAIEDEGFYEHGALNWASLVRALIENAKAGEVVQGGSTLTQQLVKNTLGLDPADQSFERKFQELALAMRVEEKYSKDQIFELYLNQVYMGNGVYGFGTAAQFYFGRPASKLNLMQGATLAGMIRAPEYFDPLDRPKKARLRRDDVMNAMMRFGFITPTRGERAKQIPIRLADNAGKLRLKRPPFFVQYLADQIVRNEGGAYDQLGKTEKTRRRTLLEGGLNIVTTLNADWQADAEAAANQPFAVTPAQPAGAPGPDTSIVTIENATGAIRTMLSGRDFRKDQRDLATTRHQPGSSWKPFLLAAAFEQGVPPTRTYGSASPFCDPRWTSPDHCVANAEGTGHGLVDLWTATADSINVVFAQLILDVGADVVDDVAQRVMGINETDFNIPGVPSLATGSVDFSPLEMAQGYQTFANGGVHCEPYQVERILRDGKQLFKHKPDCKRVLRPDIANLITAMLENVPKYGTASSAFSGWGPWPLAGKTGTARENVAVWFCGYTKQVSTAVWVGSPGNPYSMGSVFGGTLAAPIWRAYMSQALIGMPAIGFPAPPVPKTVSVPSVVGLKKAEAISLLGEAGFRVQVEMVPSALPKSTVVAQTPAGGTSTGEGSTIVIDVSNGVPGKVDVPRVIGLAEADARAALEVAGFRVEVREKEIDDPHKRGIVVWQQPLNGQKALQGTTVTITVGVKPAGGSGGGNGGGNGGGGGNGP